MIPPSNRNALRGIALAFVISPALLTTPAMTKEDTAMFKRLFPGLGKAESVPDLIALQAAAVKAVAADVTDLQDGTWEDRDWVYLAVNHEVLVGDGRRSSTQASVLARKQGAPLEDLDFRLSMSSKSHLLALRDAMAATDGRTWTVLDLTVERSGRYDFAFSYDPPPRLGGNLLHSPLTGLLDRYLREHAK